MMRVMIAIHALAVCVVMMTGHASLAQSARIENLSFDGTGDLRIFEGSITGYEVVDYVIAADAAQIISVDLQTSNLSAFFNILPVGSNVAVFTGSVQGTVADIPAPTAGEYSIRIYLMRAAARRNELAEYSLAVSIGAPEFADGLFGGPDYWKVSGVGGGDALNLRSGPGTRYAVQEKLRNGDVLGNLGCRLSGAMRWCQIRTVGAGATGWVAGQYLIETAQP
ncbi:MAG: SH3 domain-containing protein [Roseobacter sp.]